MLKNFKNYIMSVNSNMNQNSTSSSYSQAVRNARKQLKLTLEDVSHGISSVSYLSKFERNLISADKYYVKAFYEKLKIEYHDEEEDLTAEIQRILKAYLFDINELIDEKYHQYCDEPFVASKSLIKCFYYLTNSKEDDFTSEIKKLDNIKETLPKFEAIVLIYLVIKYYENTTQYEEAYKYIPLILNVHIDEKYTKCLIYDCILNVAYNLSKESLFFYVLKGLNSDIKIYYPIKKLYLNQMMELDMLAASGTVFLDDDCQSPFDEYNYYYLLIKLYRTKNYEELCCKVIDEKLWEDGKVLALFSYSAYLLDDEEVKATLEKILLEVDIEKFPKEDRLFIKFSSMMAKNTHNYEIFELLRREIIPYSDTYQHFLYTDIYKKHYVDFFASMSRYKDVWNFLCNKN